MLNLLIRLRPALLLASLVMLGIAGPSFASGSSPGPDWRDVALMAGGVVMTLITGWASLMQLALAKVKEELAQTRELVLSEYQTQEDVKNAVRAGVQEAINPVNVRLAAIGARLGIQPDHVP